MEMLWHNGQLVLCSMFQMKSDTDTFAENKGKDSQKGKEESKLATATFVSLFASSLIIQYEMHKLRDLNENE